MKALHHLTAVSIVVLIAILLQEFAVRLALPDFNPGNHLRFSPSERSLPVLGPRNKQLRLIKNSGDYNVLVKFNQHGFRDPKDVSFAKNNDVVMVGDSFAFGWGVEQDERVSEQLQRIIGRNVYNIATPSDVSGYGKLLDYAKLIGAKLKHVVVLFNMSNDIRNYNMAAKPDSKNTKKEEKMPPQLNLMVVKKYLLANSALYHLITNLTNQNHYLRKLAIKIGLIVPLKSVTKSSVNQQSIESTVNQLKLITQEYEAIILLIPNRGIWIGKNQPHERKIHAQFTKVLKYSGLRFVDLRPSQEIGGNPMRFHFKNDGHWKPIGHKLAASLLASQIVFEAEDINKMK